MLIGLADGTVGRRGPADRAPWDLRNHKGEISFPGGRIDPGETPAEAAVREAWEEVALDPAAVQLIGELEHLNTVVSRSYIVPLVARLPGRAAVGAGQPGGGAGALAAPGRAGPTRHLPLRALGRASH